MDVLSHAAVAAGTAATLTATTASPRAPVSHSLSVLTRLPADAGARTVASEQSRATGSREAAADSAAAQVRAKIAALSPSDKADVDQASQLAATLLQDWFNGTREAIGEFHSALAPDHSHRDALAGLVANLGWALGGLATDSPWLAIVQATLALGTYHEPPPFSAQLGAATSDLTTRLNGLHDQLNRNLDLVVFAALTKLGFAKYHAMSRPSQLQALWRFMFSIQPPSNDPAGFTQAIRQNVTKALARADADAAAHLKALREAWRFSLVVHTLPSGDAARPQPLTYYTLDTRRWAQATPDPTWYYTGKPGDVGMLSPQDADDPCTRPAIRARLLLELAVQRDFPPVVTSG